MKTNAGNFLCDGNGLSMTINLTLSYGRRQGNTFIKKGSEMHVGTLTLIPINQMNGGYQRLIKNIKTENVSIRH